MWHLAQSNPMWHLDRPVWEYCTRAACIYTFLLIVLRITGKRQVGQLAPFDLILLLALSNSVQNAMIGTDTSIPGGSSAAAPVIPLHYLDCFAPFNSKLPEGLIEVRTLRLLHDGHVDGRKL